MINRIILLLILSTSFAFAAQTPKKVNSESDKLLNLISNRYKNFKTIKADFIYSIESKAENINEKQKGSIYVKGNKFRLDIANQVITCDNKTIWTYSKEVNEVQVNNYDAKKTPIRLDDLFTMYDKGFLSKILETKKEGKNEIATLELTPKDKKKNFFKIKLTIDKTNQTITKSQVFDKNGTIHTYTVTNQVPNLKLEDGFFVFDVKKYPKCEVIDLR
ncbi:MAG: outer membrane lipoprotein carrier protein LolA [Bacteroidia bacterium]|nr:outer membrane lipoprotein carrier protein LolA [Bacteroidia bacterium]MBP9688685.1 outer membrane lipoprotein carrier protein LolA [Bacteroidia bacterium]